MRLRFYYLFLASQILILTSINSLSIMPQVYPRLKVRAQEQPVAIKEQETPCAVRYNESFSPESNFTPSALVTNHENEYKNDSHPSHARASIPHPKDSTTPPISAPKGKDHKELDENNKTNMIRASSVPRPRAVLSSPDNDGPIGCQNQRTKERRTPLRRQAMNINSITAQESQETREKRTPLKTQTSMHTQGKPNHNTIRPHSPKSTRKVLKEGGNKSTPKQKISERPPFTL